MENQIDLNPRIRETKIGVRHLRTVKIYPLSAAHQLQVVDLVTVFINNIANTEELSELELAEMFVNPLRENIVKILEFVTDSEDNVTMDEIDNTQVVDILDIIVEVNFGESIKKFKAVWEKASQLFRSQNLPAKSSEKPVTS